MEGPGTGGVVGVVCWFGSLDWRREGLVLISARPLFFCLGEKVVGWWMEGPGTGESWEGKCRTWCVWYRDSGEKVRVTVRKGANRTAIEGKR